MSRSTDLVVELLELASERFSNHGCNDFYIPDTPQNRELGRDILVWMDPDWVKDMEEMGEELLYVTEQGICLADYILMDYFAALIKEGAI